MASGDLKATRVGLRTLVKSLAGIPYRSAVRRCWEMSAEDIARYQLQAFLRMYEHAREHVPYYRRRPSDYPAIDPCEQGISAVLGGLPIVAKSEVRAHNAEFYAAGSGWRSRTHRTSGTTGTPLRLRATLPEKGLDRAVHEEWLLRLTGHRLPRSLYLSAFVTPSDSSERLWWEDRLSGNVYLSIYSLNDRARDKVIDLIGRLRPQVIEGYPSAVNELALLVGPALAASREERVAVVTSEVLHAQWIDNIRRYLCKSVWDHYGSQEGAHRVLQCGAGSMHIHPLVGIVEVVDDCGLPVPAGETGRVIVTGLTKRSMPLIRYDIGDLAESTGFSAGCPCGLAWPTLGPIQGRRDDLVRTRDGRRVGHLYSAIIRSLSGVHESQLVQTGYETFTCRIVADPECDRRSTETTIVAELSKRLGYPVGVTFEYVPGIARGAGGKHRAVIVDFADGSADTQAGDSPSSA